MNTANGTMNRRITAVIALMVVGLLGLVAVSQLALTPTGPTGAATIHNAAALPGRIELCGRSWQRDALDRRFTLGQTHDQFAGAVVVDPAAGSCPAGRCTNVAQPGPCDTVVWVRVGEDAYVDYALQGGP